MTTLTWRSVLAPYAVLLAVPVVLWALSNPLAGAVGVAAAVAVSAAVRRTVARIRGLASRQTVTMRLGEAVRITIGQTSDDESCPPAHCCA